VKETERNNAKENTTEQNAHYSLVTDNVITSRAYRAVDTPTKESRDGLGTLAST
jgi:hypothetical protein